MIDVQRSTSAILLAIALIAVLDISMPAGDGLKVAERVQQNLTTAGTPMIFMTASRKPGIRKRCEELGAAAFVVKPFDMEELLDAVRTAMKHLRLPALDEMNPLRRD